MKLTDVLIQQFTRDLKRLSKEIISYKSEEDLWVVDKDISNSAGNLCLHLIGNLNAFIGAELGATGYIRQREKEFGDKNVPRDQMLEQVNETISMLRSVLAGLSEENLDMDFPINVFKEKMSTRFFLVHLLGHLNYHLGQINYHRRILAAG